MTYLRCDAADDDAPDIACLTCEDTGEYLPDGSDTLAPCLDCPAGEWNFHTELLDDMRMDR
jgi:hypothetical protein